MHPKLEQLQDVSDRLDRDNVLRKRDAMVFDRQKQRYVAHPKSHTLISQLKMYGNTSKNVRPRLYEVFIKRGLV